MKTTFTRRDMLKAGTAVAATTVFAEPIRAAAPPAEAVTPKLIEAAKKEGKVVWYTSVDLPLAEKVAKAFEAKHPGIAARVERTGAERVFTRIAQEYASNIFAVDVVNSSDAAHLIVWKRRLRGPCHVVERYWRRGRCVPGVLAPLLDEVGVAAGFAEYPS
jgi:iron(III) transport system substrate-binding protein